jgi:hypothetical protein
MVQIEASGGLFDTAGLLVDQGAVAFEKLLGCELPGTNLRPKVVGPIIRSMVQGLISAPD